MLTAAEHLSELEDVVAEYGFPMLLVTVKVAEAELDGSLIRGAYEDVMVMQKAALLKGSWTASQNFIAPVLRICQLAAEYGKGLALASEMCMEVSHGLQLQSLWLIPTAAVS